MQFRDIIGHDDLKRRLRLTVLENRVAHAQLFYGVEGVGKMRLAIAYAQYVCCEHRTPDDSCGTCPNCLQFQRLEHPDLHFVFPIVNKGQSGKSSVCDDFMAEFREAQLQRKYIGLSEWGAMISREQKHLTILSAESAQINHKMSLKSYQADYKTLIIWAPERMQTEMANKLLKLIEEPPEKTLIILVSDDPKSILGTILSRTQPVHVDTLTEEQVAQCLVQNGVNMTEDELRRVAHLSRGSVLTALRIIEADEQRKQRSIIEQQNMMTDNAKDKQALPPLTDLDYFVQLMRQAWLVGNKKNYDALRQLKTWSEDIAKNMSRDQQINLLTYFENLIRENYVYNVRQPQINYMDKPEEDFAKNFARFIHAGNIEQINNELDLAIRHIAQNVNSSMVLFDLALHFILFLKAKES